MPRNHVIGELEEEPGRVHFDHMSFVAIQSAYRRPEGWARWAL